MDLPPQAKRRGPRAAAVALALALTTPALSAPQHSGEVPVSAEDLEILESRDRVELHPSDPLEIVGLGQRDNDFRAGLNAARRGNYAPSKIDTDDAYRRRIALLESGATFSAPPNRVDVRPLVPAPQPSPDAAESKPEAPEPYDTTWIGMALAALASVGIFVMRGRG